MTRMELLQIARPILFNTEMVQSILDDRKTETRRVAKIRTDVWCKNEGDTEHEFIRDDFADGIYTGFVCRKCGYGVSPPHSRRPVGTSWIRPRYEPGDYLYVRETWCQPAKYTYWYRADCEIQNLLWRPSIHMPKESARIFLRVTDVKLERLCDMDYMDAIYEGIDVPLYTDGFPAYDPLGDFVDLWNSTIKPKDRDIYGWEANPWVWVISFERIEVNHGVQGT